MAVTPTLFLLQAPIDAAFEPVPRKCSLLYSAWLHYHGKAEGCTAALNKCSLCPHCSAGKRDPASAVPDAYPGEMLDLQEYYKKKDVIWTWTEHSVSFQRTKPQWILEEKGVFSFCWRGATPVQHWVQVPEWKQVEGRSTICGNVLGAGVRSDASGRGNKVSESFNN